MCDCEHLQVLSVLTPCLVICPRLHEIAELSAAGECWQVDFKAGLFYCLAASAGQFQGVVLRHGYGAWDNHQV